MASVIILCKVKEQKTKILGIASFKNIFVINFSVFLISNIIRSAILSYEIFLITGNLLFLKA